MYLSYFLLPYLMILLYKCPVTKDELVGVSVKLSMNIYKSNH